MTYGTIITSLLSVGFTAVDVLFVRDGELNLKVGDDKTRIKEGSFKSYFMAFLAASMLVLWPKITMFSWVLATFRWRSLLFFIPIILVVWVVKLCRSGNMNVHEAMKKAAVDTFFDVFGIRKNMLSSAMTLFLLSILAILVIACTMPRSNNEYSVKFNTSSDKIFYQTNPDSKAETCICQNIPSRESIWRNQYYEEDNVCMRDVRITLPSYISVNESKVPFKNTKYTCYDPIFFQIPLDFSILPTKDFPSLTTCFTYDSLEDYLMKVEVTSAQHWFDENCNPNITGIVLPCSDELVSRITAGLSIMIVWMCFGVVVVILSKQIGKLLLKTKTWYIFCLLIALGILGGMGYAVYYLIEMLISNDSFNAIYEDGLSRDIGKIQLKKGGSESCQRINERMIHHLVERESTMTNTISSTPKSKAIREYYYCTTGCAGVCTLGNETHECKLENYTSDWYYHSYKIVLKIIGIFIAVASILLAFVGICFRLVGGGKETVVCSVLFSCLLVSLGIVSVTMLGIYCTTQDINNLKERIQLENGRIEYFQNDEYDLSNKTQTDGNEHINCTSDSTLSEAYISSYVLAWKMFGISVAVATGMGMITCHIGRSINEDKIMCCGNGLVYFVFVFEFLIMIGFGIYCLITYHFLS